MDNKQCSDSARKGPGFSTSLRPSAPSAPSVSPAGNGKSGTSQSERRGKQG
jgi:hypothetical protein